MAAVFAAAISVSYPWENHSTFSFLTLWVAASLFNIRTSRMPSLKLARAVSVMVSTGSLHVLMNEP